MLVSPRAFQEMVTIVAEVTADYKSRHPLPHTVRSVDALAEIARARSGHTITFKDARLEGEPKSVYGGCVRNADDSHVIITRDGINYCWRRFVRAKELFHVILDTPESYATHLYEHLEETMAALPLFQDASPPVVSEMVAEIAAMEFLFPFAERTPVLQKYRPFDSLEVAKLYRIPRHFIERYLSGTNMGQLGAFYRLTAPGTLEKLEAPFNPDPEKK